VSQEVKAILKASCYDCHSNETVWPWYSKTAPASFLISRDVNNGREHMNFSTWGEYEKREIAEMKEESWEMIEKKKGTKNNLLELFNGSICSVRDSHQTKFDSSCRSRSDTLCGASTSGVPWGIDE